MRKDSANGRALTVLALIVTLLGMSRPAAAQDTVTRVRLVPMGTRVMVHVYGPRVTPRIGEPFYLPDRTRLHVMIDGVTLARDAVSPDGAEILDAGLLGLVARERDGGVRVSIEASAITRYGIEPQPGGFVFWLVPAPTIAPRIAAASPAVGPHGMPAAGSRRTPGWRP